MFARLAPSMQTLLPLNITNAAAASSAAAGSQGTALPLESYQGYLDTVPEEGMSGGAVVDSQCGLLGVTEKRSVYGEGGELCEAEPQRGAAHPGRHGQAGQR